MGQYDDEIEIFFWPGAAKKRRLQRATRFDDDFLPIRKKSICAAAIKQAV
jgi:Ni,Fe-hydrogenase III component G